MLPNDATHHICENVTSYNCNAFSISQLMHVGFLNNYKQILWLLPDTFRSGQNIQNKVRKSSKIGKDYKFLIFTFMDFLTFFFFLLPIYFSRNENVCNQV